MASNLCMKEEIGLDPDVILIDEIENSNKPEGSSKSDSWSRIDYTNYGNISTILHICVHCNLVFKFKSNLSIHHLLFHGVENSDENGTYASVWNIASAGSPKADLNHLEEATFESKESYKTHKCPSCNKCFGKAKSLSRHALLHESYNSIERANNAIMCDKCMKSFENSAALLEHYKEHTEKIYVCATCKMGFAKKHNLSKHLRRHTVDKAKFVERQRRALDVYNKEYLHANENPSENKLYICGVCKKCFTTKAYLRSHKENTCLKSDEATLTENLPGQEHLKLLIRHDERGMSVETNVEKLTVSKGPHCCVICSTSFGTQKRLHYHSMLHSGGKPYYCSDCKTCLRRREDLREHQRRHREERRFPCDDCKIRFKTKFHLNRHMSTQTHLAKMASFCVTYNKR